MKFSDKELVNGMLANDERIVCHFFFDACLPIFNFIIQNIFNYKINKKELISELYLYLRENGWHKLRQFDYRSKLIAWLSVVAIRFFKKEKRTDSKRFSNHSIPTRVVRNTVQLAEKMEITGDNLYKLKWRTLKQLVQYYY